MVANLKNMAVDMSAEITDQNQQLERIHIKVSLKTKMTGILICIFRQLPMRTESLMLTRGR